MPHTHSLLRVLLAALLVMGVGSFAHSAAALTNTVGLNGDPCAYATLGAAVAAAASGDTIYVAPGTYTEVLGTLDKDLHLVAATADCAGADPAASPFQHVIDGGGAVGVNGGLVNLAAGRTVTFTRLMLRNAQALDGGLVFVSSGAAASFNTVRLEDGHANSRGGLIYVAPTGSLSVQGTSFFQEGEAGSAGGALYLEGQADLHWTTVRLSTAPLGGGVALAGLGALRMNGGSLGDGPYPNSAGTGGGVYMTGQSRLELYGLAMVRFNHATTDDGGGIYATGDVEIEVYDNVRIYGNDAIRYGGGVYAANGARVSLSENSRVGDAVWVNSAVRGGGLYADGAEHIFLRDQASVHHNYAGDGGGGLYLTGNAPLLASGGVISANTTSGWGGGLALDHGQASLAGTVLAQNEAMEGGGAGVSSHASNFFVAVNSQIISNTANLDGGGVHTQFEPVYIVDTAGTSQLSGNTAGQNGGAMWGNGGTLHLRAEEPGSWLRVEGNTASGGGALYSTGDGGAYLIGNVHLSGNLALGNGGGWYQSGGESLVTAVSQSLRPRLEANLSLNGHGGGAYFTGVSSGGGVPTQLLDVLIAGNQADQDGGGLYVAGGSSVQLTNAHVHANTAGQDGGGVMVVNAELAVELGGETCQNALQPANHYCSELRGNAATGDGGAVGLAGASAVSLENTAVIANSAATGSAVYSASNGDHLEITNSLITHNTGKAVFIAADGYLDLVHTTFTANDWALDIDDNGAGADLHNNIIWGNGFGVQVSMLPTVGCSISQNGVAGTNSDPQFVTTARGDYRLALASPAADACLIGTDADLDGVARPYLKSYDMGAFEAGLPVIQFPALLEVTEGNADATSAQFIVSLSQTSAQTVTVDVDVANGTATSGVDFNVTPQTLTFAPGATSQALTVDVLGDGVYENNEVFALHLSNAAGAALPATSAEVVIVDDDGFPALTVHSTSVTEGDSGLTPVDVEVTLSHASAFTVTVLYGTTSGTAAAGTDFESALAALEIPPGETMARIPLHVLGDENKEADEHFGVWVSFLDGAWFAASGSQGYVTIQNDDGLTQVYLPMVIR